MTKHKSIKKTLGDLDPLIQQKYYEVNSFFGGALDNIFCDKCLLWDVPTKEYKDENFLVSYKEKDGCVCIIDIKAIERAIL